MMILKSFIFTFFFASLVIIHAKPLIQRSSSSSITIEKRNTNERLFIPQFMALSPNQQVSECILIYITTNQTPQLNYKDLIQECKDAVTRSDPEDDNGAVDAVLLPGPALLPIQSTEQNGVESAFIPTAPPLTTKHKTPVSDNANPDPNPNKNKEPKPDNTNKT